MRSSGPRIRRSTKLLAVIPVFLTATIVLVANSWADSSQRATDLPPPAGFNSLADVPEECRDAAALHDLNFPKDVALPSVENLLSRTLKSSDRGPVAFQDGYGESLLVAQWRCAWERAFVDAHAEADQDNLALAAHELQKYYELPLVKKYVHDPEELWSKEVVEPALRGDFTAMTADLQHNCDPIFGG